MVRRFILTGFVQAILLALSFSLHAATMAEVTASFARLWEFNEATLLQSRREISTAFTLALWERARVRAQP